MANDAADASAINERGWRAWRQAPMSNGCSSAPSNIRLTPGKTTSLVSESSESVFTAVGDGVSSVTDLVAASYTGVSAWDL
jgi:hypothetical protein